MKTSQHLSRRILPVDWRSHEWSVVIHRRPARRFPQGLFFEQDIACRDPRSAWMISGPSFMNPGSFMHTRYSYRSTRPQAFTLIEMLVVIAIIAILAGILLPTLGTIKTRAKVKQAQMEMATLAAAIKAYEKEYNRYPGSKLVEDNGNPDFTYGNSNAGILTGKAFESDNSLLMFILLNRTDKAPVALNIQGRNPRKLSLFDAKWVQDNDPGGVGTGDHVFRDPWGNPYIITIDINGDDKCVDAYYKTIGGAGFVLNGADQEFGGDVMIWSFGPDKRSGGGADKDNVLSWKH